MKVLDKVTITVFSIILLTISIIMCLLVFGWLSTDVVYGIISGGLNNATYSTIILVVSVIVMLMAIKCIFFSDESEMVDGQKDGILLENKDGKLLISKDTLENLVSSIAKGFEGAENVVSKIVVDEEKNVNVFVSLMVHPDAVIKDLSSNLQMKIKEAIKATSGLEVKEVNVRIKNIAPEKIKIEE